MKRFLKYLQIISVLLSFIIIFYFLGLIIFFIILVNFIAISLMYYWLSNLQKNLIKAHNNLTENQQKIFKRVKYLEEKK